MGLDRAVKQVSGGGKHGHGDDHDPDPGVLHAAQVGKEHGKPTVDALSSEAMNDALLLVAQGLHGALVKSEALLKAGGFQVSVYNQTIEEEHSALDVVEKRYDAELDKANSSEKTIDKLANQIENHRGTLNSTRIAKNDFIAGIRDRTFEPLLKGKVQELQEIAAEAQYFGWSADQHAKVATGANYLRSMLKQVHELGKNLELGSSPSLAALEKALDEIVAAMNLTVSDGDAKELDSVNPYVLLQKSVRDNLIAAEAQAKNAYASVHAWTARAKTATFAHVEGSVQAVRFHISDAVDLLGQLKPADRHQFKPMLHGLAHALEAVYHIGRLQPNGHAPAGSASQEIDSFPTYLDELRKAIGA